MIVILADDFTGAYEAAVQFAKAGYDTRVRIVHGPGDGTGEVYALSADDRDCEGEAARFRARTTLSVFGEPIDRLYIKVGPTLSGTSRYHMTGAGETWDLNHRRNLTVVCPADPATGYQVVNGQVWIMDVPADPIAGYDPGAPVLWATVAEQMPRAKLVQENGDWASSFRAAIKEGTRLASADATTDADLDRLAAGMTAVPGVVPVGSVGLAGACARTWRRADGFAGRPAGAAAGSPAVPPADYPRKHGRPGTGPVVGLVSSIEPIARAQVDRLVAETGRRTIVRQPNLATAAWRTSLRAWAERVADEAGDAGTVLVVRPEERTSDKLLADDLAIFLGDAAAYLADRLQASALVLVGEAGTQSALANLDITELRIWDQIGPGIPVTTAYDGRPGLPVLTKAGHLGDAGTLRAMVEYVRTMAYPTRRPGSSFGLG